MLTVKTFNSIDAIPEQLWQKVANENSVCYSVSFMRILEDARINDLSFKYLLFFSHNEPVAISCTYTITTDLAIFSKGLLKKILNKIRQFFPNFLKFKILECATPITINPPFLLAHNLVEQGVFIGFLDSTLRKIASKEKAFLIVCRDFEKKSFALESEFRKFKYHLVQSLPSTMMKVKWSSIEDYLCSMKSYYRSKVKRHLKINQQKGISAELVDDFKALSNNLAFQWQVVFNNANEYQRESLNASFYQKFSEDLGSNSKAILFYREHVIIGHALLLIDGNRLRWLYFGRNKAVNDSLYLFVVYSVIKTAIELKVDEIELGLTTYSIKKDFGAIMTENKMALKARFFFFNYFVGFVYPLLNQVPAIHNKSVFKKN